MGKICAVCKTNPAVLSAKIADRETGVFSAPIPLCEECYSRVSKARKTETVPDPDLVSPAQGGTIKSIAPSAASESVYLKNFYGLSNLCNALKYIFIAVLIIGFGALIIAIGNGPVPLLIASASAIACSLANIVLFHILSRTFEGVADYMKRK